MSTVCVTQKQNKENMHSKIIILPGLGKKADSTGVPADYGCDQQ